MRAEATWAFLLPLELPLQFRGKLLPELPDNLLFFLEL